MKLEVKKLNCDHKRSIWKDQEGILRCGDCSAPVNDQELDRWIKGD